MAGNRQDEKGIGVLRCGQGRQGAVLNQQAPILWVDGASESMKSDSDLWPKDSWAKTPAASGDST